MSSDSPNRLQKALQERLVAGLFCHIPATVIGALFVFGVNFVYYREQLAMAHLVIWGALLGAFGVGRLLILAYYHRQPQRFSAVTWRNLHASTAIAHSLSWCVLLISVIHLDDRSLTAIATISVGAVIGASIATTSASIVSFSCFIVPLVIALPAAMFPYEDAFELTLAGGWVALLVFMLVSGHRLHTTLARAEQTRIEKETLVDKLQHLSERDPLTNLYNRRHFTSRLDAAWT
ncbi:MAG: GGDEF domain-containing protein, partial [Pseudomonadota bacterium]